MKIFKLFIILRKCSYCNKLLGIKLSKSYSFNGIKLKSIPTTDGICTSCIKKLFKRY